MESPDDRAEVKPFPVFVILGLIALVSILALGCGPPAAPQAPAQGRWSVDWRGHPELPGMERALAIIFTRGAAECADDDCRARLAAVWQGDILWYDDPFLCGQGLAQNWVNGCWFLDASIAVGWHAKISETVLADELGHLVWFIAHGRVGEDTSKDPIVYDADYSAWVDATKLAIASEGF